MRNNEIPSAMSLREFCNKKNMKSQLKQNRKKSINILKNLSKKLRY